MELKPGYKMTEVGVIPEEWSVTSLSTLVDQNRKITYGIVVPGPETYDGVPMIRAQDYSNGWVDIENLYCVSHTVDKAYRRSRVITGDVLLTIVGSVGNLAKVPYDFDGSNITQQTARLSFNKKIADADYYLNFLLADVGKKIISNYTKSGVQPSLNLSDIEKFVLPYPPLPEQHAIAEALSDVDALLAALDRLIAKKRDLKQATMQQLLTGQTRLPGDWNENSRYKPSEIGLVPEDWDVAILGNNTEKVGSGITPTGGERVYTKEGRPFIRSQNVGWGILHLDDIAYIDEITHSTFMNTEINEGDVFLNITGASIGRSAVADYRVKGGNVNQHVCIIRTNSSKLAPQYLNYFLISAPGQRQIDSFQAGGNRQGLNFGQVRTIRLPLPPLPEQTAIAAVLSDMDAELAALEQRRAKTRLLKQAMMQELLTGRIRLVENAAPPQPSPRGRERL